MAQNKEIKRVLNIQMKGTQAAFLWGPRKTGKTTLLKNQFPNAKFYDLLLSIERSRLTLNPNLMREEILATKPKLVVIDEVQKVPELLDEVHWCIENTATQFILCGSSARKLKNQSSNMLGGRAWRFELFPLTIHELGEKADIVKLANRGSIPSHYNSSKPEKSLISYIADYLQEEIQAEALVRNLSNFNRFLESAAFSHTEMINFSNIARDVGVNSKTIKAHYQILYDTLLAHTLPAWRKQQKRKLIETDKFYFFDAGVARALKGMQIVQPKTFEFGAAFEQILIEEIRAYKHYQEKYQKISYWRTTSDQEVDTIVGNMECAIEFKTTDQVKSKHVKNLRVLLSEHTVKHSMVVSLDSTPRQLADGIMVYPWKVFCEKLWAGEFF